MSGKSLIVVGAGMIGAACALRLQASGQNVTLIDPGPDTRASSFGNAGHIAVEQVEPLATWSAVRRAPSMLFGVGGPLDFRLGDASAWLPWSARFLWACRSVQVDRGTQALRQLTTPAVRAWRDLLSLADSSDLMIEDGHALLWFDEEAAREGRGLWQSVDTGAARLGELPADRLETYRSLLPGRPPVAGLYVEGTARLVSPQRTRDALVDAFVRKGGCRLVAEVQGVSPHGEIKLTGGARLQADQILIAAGIRSAFLMAQLGHRVPLIAERGYSIQFPVPAWSPGLGTAVLEDYSIVLAPHAEGLRATSFVEFARADSAPDARKWARLIARLRALGLDVPEACQRWMGCRPTLPDYVPAIGTVPQARVLYAFGHQHLGVTLAAITAECIEAAAGGAELPHELDIRRFLA